MGTWGAAKRREGGGGDIINKAQDLSGRNASTWWLVRVFVRERATASTPTACESRGSAHDDLLWVALTGTLPPLVPPPKDTLTGHFDSSISPFVTPKRGLRALEALWDKPSTAF